MPELPEVTTIVNDLEPRVVNRRIVGIDILWPGTIVHPDPEDLQGRLMGQPIVGVRRRAKLIVIDLASGDRLVVHLRMTGRLLLRPAEAEPDQFVRVVFRLDDGQQLRLADARKFGSVKLMASAEFEKLSESLGREPLGPDFALERFREMLGGRGARIKPLLLDQTFLAGMGNIYVDEALFESGIHPARRASSLGEAEVARLYQAIRHVLQEGIKDRGTTFISYVDAYGRRGGHQFNLKAYRRAGDPCPRCATAIQRIVVGGRGTYICPRCQALTPAAA
ncbi:MAG: bifunctional DNA-formamidopyrimidine glycosylase/DNA-(apurinic or apyrimidinic site) lyase [Chloroflexi bacterium]|nr:bifunctional DNA-formamidopyrimidine glycosylase/DNA-(apurinic or apyrimidinic site) lyase [Chloroflexota bacterium]